MEITDFQPGRYSQADLAALLNVKGNDGIKKKLKRLHIDCSCSGWGSSIIYTINSIPPLALFTVYCERNLKTAFNLDYEKFCTFVYYFIHDEEFRWLPDKTLEDRMSEKGKILSRQTIKNYKQYLLDANLYGVFNSDCVYYFAKGQDYRMAAREEYIAAWALYWEVKNATGDSFQAIGAMISKYGGVARKQKKALPNALTGDILDDLSYLTWKYIEAESDISD